MEEAMENAQDGALSATVERLAAAAEMLERAAEQLTAGQNVFREEMQSTVARIVATTEKSEEVSGLESRLQAAMKEIAELRAQQGERGTARKTVVNLLAKQGGAGVDVSALDAALSSLSIEQRIAVKSQLLRAGVV
jgi:predicted RNase H-like nuclease (RuvC/YqgF family)